LILSLRLCCVPAGGSEEEVILFDSFTRPINLQGREKKSWKLPSLRRNPSRSAAKRPKTESQRLGAFTYTARRRQNGSNYLDFLPLLIPSERPARRHEKAGLRVLPNHFIFTNP
jgi:hypothetical protein